MKYENKERVRAILNVIEDLERKKAIVDQTELASLSSVTGVHEITKNFTHARDDDYNFWNRFAEAGEDFRNKVMVIIDEEIQEHVDKLNEL